MTTGGRRRFRLEVPGPAEEPVLRRREPARGGEEIAHTRAGQLSDARGLPIRFPRYPIRPGIMRSPRARSERPACPVMAWKCLCPRLPVLPFPLPYLASEPFPGHVTENY